jgi:DNA-binding XRE family transcriptional regulator
MTGTAMRQQRRRAGFTQRALALKLGLHWNTVARMERGELAVPTVVALAVAAVAARRPKATRHE